MKLLILVIFNFNFPVACTKGQVIPINPLARLAEELAKELNDSNFISVIRFFQIENQLISKMLQHAFNPISSWIQSFWKVKQLAVIVYSIKFKPQQWR